MSRLVGTLALLGLLASCESDVAFELRGRTMGTGYTVVLADATSAARREAIARDIDSTLAELTQVFSTYVPDSEVSRFNASPSTGWRNASADLDAVLGIASRMATLTGGALDVTLGPAVDLWGFGPADAIDRPPSSAELDALRERVGSQHLEHRSATRRWRKRNPFVAVDYSALAKGYAVDRIAALLGEHGFTNYLVDIGGEIRTRGRNARGADWVIAVEIPGQTPATAQRRLALSNLSIATSGHHRNAFTHGGKRYSHILDPRTLHPVQHAAASVTVVHDEAAVADALATALLVMGPQQGMQLAKEQAWPVLMLRATEDGFDELATPQMRALYVEDSD